MKRIKKGLCKSFIIVYCAKINILRHSMLHLKQIMKILFCDKFLCLWRSVSESEVKYSEINLISYVYDDGVAIKRTFNTFSNFSLSICRQRLCVLLLVGFVCLYATERSLVQMIMRKLFEMELVLFFFFYYCLLLF